MATEHERKALAMRLSRHIAFRRRIEPKRRTGPGELDYWLARIGAKLRDRRDVA